MRGSIAFPSHADNFRHALLFHRGTGAKSCRLRPEAASQELVCRPKRLPEFMQEIARRCPFRSRETFDLTAAQELRQMAADLDDKALQCEGIDCDKLRTGDPLGYILRSTCLRTCRSSKRLLLDVT